MKKVLSKIFKILLIIFGVFIVLFSIHFFRNYIIVSNLKSKFQEYNNSTNYYSKRTYVTSLQTIITTRYQKDNNILVSVETEIYGETSKVIYYDNGEFVNEYYERAGQKYARLNIDRDIQIYGGVYEFVDTITIEDILKYIIVSDDYNGIDCYKMIIGNDVEVYIEKSTGLYIAATVDGETFYYFEYEFNSVDDSVFEQPNDYELFFFEYQTE